jgi:hypothetical protein
VAEAASSSSPTQQAEAGRVSEKDHSRCAFLAPHVEVVPGSTLEFNTSLQFLFHTPTKSIATMKSISTNALILLAAPIVGLVVAIFHTTAVAPTQLVVSAFILNTPFYTTNSPSSSIKHYHQVLQSTTNNEETANEISKAPTLNGKAVLPLKAMKVGLKGHKVAAVYALLNKNYKRG